MVIHTHAGWHYDLDINPTASGGYRWLVLRFRGGMSASSEMLLASGLAYTRGQAMEAAEQVLEDFLHEAAAGGDRVRR